MGSQLGRSIPFTWAVFVAMSGCRGNTNSQHDAILFVVAPPDRMGSRLRMNTLQGKIALITGAASGIGRASALLFAAEGAAVVALDRAPEVEATVSAIRSSGGRAVALIRDSSVEEDVAGAVALAVKEYGGLDVCFANAGISGGRGGLFELGEADWAALLRVNLIGPFLAIKHGAQESDSVGCAM